MTVKNPLLDLRPGEYRIIRVDGTEELHEEKPYILTLCKLMGCTVIDTVTLDHQRKIVMIVDDTGMVDDKPVNPKATALYRDICVPGTTWSIHGDVAIVNDKDFA